MAIRTRFYLGLAVLFLGGLTGCQTVPPDDAMSLPAEQLERRQVQTREYDGIGEASLLAACAGVLQDLGFNLDESDTTLGLIVASKENVATDELSSTAALLLELFLDLDIALDIRQVIRVSLVVRERAEQDNSHAVRVNFQRIVWDDENQVSQRESMDDLELYQQFFERLSKSVFLEAQQI